MLYYDPYHTKNTDISFELINFLPSANGTGSGVSKSSSLFASGVVVAANRTHFVILNQQITKIKASYFFGETWCKNFRQNVIVHNKFLKVKCPSNCFLHA
ncbi:hypothetical protein HanRHA438_Chr16g0764121 [Helianthus annuus]|nr:hypothetical protein HanRHA438_Chr16g0764121 [Helianthus annuus]